MADNECSCSALWKLQSSKYAFSFDLVVKQDSRLRTKLGIQVRDVFVNVML
jgi:hypothetical protein